MNINDSDKKVVIVDDQNLFAEGIAKIVNGLDKVKVIATIDSGENITYQLSILQPDVLFLDLNLPKKNGLEILKEIRGKFPDLIIAILTMYEDAYLIKKIREHKANAFLSKSASIDEIQQVIFSGKEDPFYISKNINEATNSSFELVEDPFSVSVQITQREKEIIRLIVDGKSTEEISDILIISSETVKSHRKNIFRKLNLSKVTELIKYAYEYKLI
ncbi:response regulator [Carboxylicivirga caseinilyticus]|uniref:response regulator n=1 Tax=Carboxylicivirga caseinilyticus TaxID=3417572 RepID=UPI003D358DAB|nr:response regulator transcription factor [Marinilabiliaceae bacterium A049]